MAAPASMTTLNLSAKFQMNKTLSDDSDPILVLQGVGWFTRKAIALATITLAIKHYKDDDGVEHIDIDQTLTGGIKGTTEERALDWTDRPHSDHIFGNVVGKSRRVKLEELKDEKWLTEGWEESVKETGAIESFVLCEKGGWSAHQVWGFEVIDGVRRYVRHVVVEKASTRLEKRLVYDYLSPLQ